MRKAGTAALVAGAVLAAGAPVAEATRVHRAANGAIIVDAEPGETNRIYLNLKRRDFTYSDSTFYVHEFGRGARLVAGPRCGDRRMVRDAPRVTCGGDYPPYVIVRLGDRDDVYKAGYPSARTQVYGEAGNDTIQPNILKEPGGADNQGLSSRSNDYYDGGPGRDMVDYKHERNGDLYVALDGRQNDGVLRGEYVNERDNVVGFEDITGGARDDTLVGDDRNNDIRGWRGRDVIRAGGGDDYLDEGDEVDADIRYGRNGDTLDGGPGSDLVTYQFRSFPVGATIGDGANDGFAREQDNIGFGVERVIGSPLDDVLVGTDRPDVQEVLTGGAGDDTINPRAGPDRVHAGPGDDTIELRDGFVDFFSTGTGVDNFFREGQDVRMTP